MKIAIIGRTHWLIAVARHLKSSGHSIVLVVTATARPEYGVKESDFKQLAKDVNAPYIMAPDINSPEFRDELARSKAEVGVSINWPTLIRKETCESLNYGILNSHAGDLPRYRGNACPNWAIINNEPHVGICIHAMDPDAVDAGDVYVREKLPLDDNVYIGDIYASMEEKIPAMFAKALQLVKDPEFRPEVQKSMEIEPLRCHPRRPEDGLIEWGNSAEAIIRLVRASSHPQAGAYSYLEGRIRLTIWRAQKIELDHAVLAVPGQIIGRGSNGGVLVACGTGIIEIETAELADGTPLPSANRFRLENRVGVFP